MLAIVLLVEFHLPLHPSLQNNLLRSNLPYQPRILEGASSGVKKASGVVLVSVVDCGLLGDEGDVAPY